MRFKYDRAARIAADRKASFNIVTMKNAPVIFAFRVIGGVAHLKAWTGRADKPAFYYTFRGGGDGKESAVGRMEAYAEKYAADVARALAVKKERKATGKAKRAALKASDHWTAGDVFYNSWGYDQTNIDWYQVTEVQAKSIMVRPIAGVKSYNPQYMSGNTQPDRGAFTGEAFRKNLDADGGISMEFGCATKWDGKAKGYSCYA